jgi:transcriptional regulator with XRE-family HTH domain/desulfoferrodoxin (superoxide reductase-like protein)
LDCRKVGTLFFRLRKEKGLTQKQVADHMNLIDKTISKWERGLGYSDVNLLGELSNLFEINIEKILNGNLETNALDSGNFRRLKFYVCPACGNVITNTGNAEISCCGRRLSPLAVKSSDNEHRAVVEDTDGEFLVTFHHEMEKGHYISFVAYVTNEKLLLVKLYPEQEASVRLPKMGSLLHKYNTGFYYCCSRHGLYVL